MKWNPVHVGGAVIVGGIVASLAYVALYGDGHEPAPYEPSGVLDLVVCPSASWALEEVGDAAGWWDELGYPLLGVRRGECAAGPADGELQVRADGDAVEGWDQYLMAAELDVVGVHEGRGVMYIDRFGRRACTVEHAVGHALGVGHTTAASSVMHPLCGESASGL